MSKFKSDFFDLFESLVDFEKGFDFHPKTILNNSSEGYVLKISVPGLTKEDIQIVLDGRNLKVVNEKENLDFVSKFNKIYTLPTNVDVDNIDGKVENGVLTLTLPIIKKTKQERIITIK